MKSTTVVLFLAAVVSIGSPAASQETADGATSVRIAVQQICPVSGEKLGAHGRPVKAMIGEEEVFLCCSGCLKAQVKPEHWLTIHKNMAVAQRICPVMENPLPRHPKWTIVNGRLLFVCCPPCIDDIKADPDKFTKRLDALYAESLTRARP